MGIMSLTGVIGGPPFWVAGGLNYLAALGLRSYFCLSQPAKKLRRRCAGDNELPASLCGLTGAALGGVVGFVVFGPIGAVIGGGFWGNTLYNAAHWGKKF